MDPQIDEVYFSWLYSQIELAGDRSYSNLLEQFFLTQFEWFVPNDDNRAKDGIDLRKRFIFERSNGKPDKDWMAQGCSFLEMLIALSTRLSFNMDVSQQNAFWHMVRNLGFDETYSDDYVFNEEDVDRVLQRVIWRSYQPDGSGGIFPLCEPKHDQREIELIYQMYSYALEQDF